MDSTVVKKGLMFIMNDGQLVEAGTTEQIFNEPKEEYTKYLLSACTLERR